MEEGRPFDPEQAKAKLAELEATIFFEKVLTNSDASGSGRIVIPKVSLLLLLLWHLYINTSTNTLTTI